VSLCCGLGDALSFDINKRKEKGNKNMGQAQPVFPSLFSFTFLSLSPSLLSAQHSLSLFFFFLSFSLLSPLCH